MFNSLHARMTRTAISPRLATRTFSNMLGGANLEQGLTEFDRLGVLDEDGGDHAASFGLDLVHDLHRLDDADNGVRVNFRADFDVIGGFGRGSAINRADHR